MKLLVQHYIRDEGGGEIRWNKMIVVILVMIVMRTLTYLQPTLMPIWRTSMPTCRCRRAW